MTAPSFREDRRAEYRRLSDDELIALGVTFTRNSRTPPDPEAWWTCLDDARQVAIERGLLPQLEQAVREAMGTQMKPKPCGEEPGAGGSEKA